MGSFLKADRKETLEIVTPPADNLCNLCDGNDRGLYAEMFRDSKMVKRKFQRRQNRTRDYLVESNSAEKKLNTTGRTYHSGLGANTVCLGKDSRIHIIKRKEKKQECHAYRGIACT